LELQEKQKKETTMKIKRIFQIIMVLAVLAMPVMLTSCASSDGTVTQQAATMTTFKDTWAVALAAYDLYCERVALGKVSAEGELKADAAWNLFRTTFKQALTQFGSNLNSPAPPFIQADARNIASTLSSVR